MVSHRSIKKLMGQQIQCHTHFGTFTGVVVHITKWHLILGVNKVGRQDYLPASVDDELRPYPMGPGGPGGPMGPGPGGGWQLAIPLAAILGVTALGMHWW